MQTSLAFIFTCFILSFFHPMLSQASTPFPDNKIPINTTTNTNKNETSLFLNSTLLQLTDTNIQEHWFRNRNSSLFVIFTVKSCSRCNPIFSEFEKAIHTINETNRDITFAKVDVYTNNWSAMRFNIYKIPQIWYFKHNQVSYMNTTEISKKTIVEFYSNPGVFGKIPKQWTYFGLFMKFFNLITDYWKVIMEEQGFFWNKFCTGFCFAIILLLIWLFEWYLIKNCCSGRRKKNQDKPHWHIKDKEKEKEKENKKTKVQKHSKNE